MVDGMAHGLVPVCLDSSPADDRKMVMHEETGLLVKDRDESFCSAIHRLAADEPFRLRLAKNAGTCGTVLLP